MDDLSLTVRPGEVVGLIGPNGAGKTSAIDAISGFTRIAAGAVKLNEVNLAALPPHARTRAGLSRSFQSLELFLDMTVRENLAVASDDHKTHPYITDLVRPMGPSLDAEAVAAIEEFGLGIDLHRLPSELPHGRQRLLAIARAVASGPSILMLDEPAAGLDETETRELAARV